MEIIVAFFLLVVGFALFSLSSLAIVGKAYCESLIWGVSLSIIAFLLVTALFFIDVELLHSFLYIAAPTLFLIFTVVYWKEIWKLFVMQTAGIPLFLIGAFIFNHSL